MACVSTLTRCSFLLFLLSGSSIGYAETIMEGISPYIDQRKIALDPVLLKTDDVSSFDFSQVKPDSRSPSKTDQDRLSALETLYSQRAQSPLRQFGYDLLAAHNTQPDTSSASSGAVQESYILESGDEVNVILRGQRNLSVTTTITSDGQLVIDDLPPVSAAGRTLKSVHEEVQSIIREYYNTDIFLSVSRIRQINILVAGEVEHPGQFSLSTFDTVIDALTKAGGLKKAGTMRQIKLLRDNQSTFVDLYGLLVYGSDSSDLSLRDGDKIIVGPIGPTLAVSGSVKRAGIYEILPAQRAVSPHNESESQTLSASDLLDLSGGVVLQSRTRYVRLSTEDQDIDSVSNVDDLHDRVFGEGSILVVGQSGPMAEDKLYGSISLKGAVRNEGYFSLAETPSLGTLLSSPKSLAPNAYPLIGLIERWNETTLSNEIVSFSPEQILSGRSDLPLMESDTVHLFTRDEIIALINEARPDPTLSNTEDEERSENDISVTRLAHDLHTYLKEHTVFIRGSVRGAGAYPIARETTLDKLLAVAGGASFEAGLKNVEITQPYADPSSQRTMIDLSTTPSHLITLNPGDTIRINQKFRRIEDHHVYLGGEIKNPGTYDLIAGDTLGTLVQRAGGLTNEAYPDGAIFSRKSERQREEQRFKNQARELEISLAASLENKDEKETRAPDPKEIALARELIAELKNSEAVGRLTVEADPNILSTHPEQDILLEAGDKIFIPKRPLTVRVAGEVLSPAALQFRSGKVPRDYINEAGGFTYNADSDRAFVVFPDGSAQPLAVSTWNHQASLIPPGSTIIVPRDPKPLTFMDGAKDLSQILANLATTAIFSEDIADGD